MTLEAIENYGEVTIDIASEETEVWQKTNNLKAFLFHKNDIDCLFQNKAAVGVRFYMGLEIEESAEENTIYTPDMMVVGADSSGHDLVNEEGVSGVYNFALPCPRACDTDSPLFYNGDDSTTKNLCAASEHTYKFSTADTCNILEYSISLNTAIKRTERWQTYNVLRSILVWKEDVYKIFEEYSSEEQTINALRIYFAFSKSGLHRIIFIGAEEATNGEGELYYADVPRAYLYTNDLAPCTMTHTKTCASESPLCHGCS